MLVLRETEGAEETIGTEFVAPAGHRLVHGLGVRHLPLPGDKEAGEITIGSV